MINKFCKRVNGPCLSGMEGNNSISGGGAGGGVGGGGKGQMVLMFLENYEGDHDLNEKVMKGELEGNY